MRFRQILTTSARLLLATATVATLSCRASYPAAPTHGGIVALHMQYPTATADVSIGTPIAFRAFAVTGDAVYQDVTRATSWFSSDPLVVRVIGSTITAVGPGTANVVGAYQGFTDALKVSVSPTPLVYPRIGFQFGSGGPGVIGGLPLEVYTTYYNSSTSWFDMGLRATWSSSNPQVATADRARVTAVAPGTVEITASYNGITGRFGYSVQPRTQ